MGRATRSELSVRAASGRVALSLLAFVSACASAPPPAQTAVPAARSLVAAAQPPAPSAHAEAPDGTAQGTPESCPRALALDAAAVSAEVACLLAQYVRIDTTNPPGNELAAALFLRAVLARDGIAADIIESAPGRANLIARLPSARSGGRAVVLLHHMDVVPASAGEWSAPPFSATVREGQLWGRGALDDKGPGIAQLMAMVLAKRLGTPLARDLLLVAVADEESGGAHGARFLVEQHAQLFQHVDFVLNEGGAVLDLGEGPRIYSVELAQKAPLWLRLTARGPSGHGGAPRPDSAVKTLLRGLSRLADHEFPIEVVPEVQALFAARAPAMPEPMRKDYGDLKAALKRPAFRAKFLSSPQDAALVRNTLAITMLRGSDKENVISGEASAVLDIRLLPGQTVDAVTAEVVRVLKEPTIALQPLLSWQAFTSPPDPGLFAALEQLAAARNPGAKVVANVIGGFTDCNAFRTRGIKCYGFLPMRVKPEMFGLIHGKDERIVLEDLAAATVDLHALLGGLQ